MSKEILSGVSWLKFAKGNGTEYINPMHIVGLYCTPGEIKTLRLSDGTYNLLTDKQVTTMLELIGETRDV